MAFITVSEELSSKGATEVQNKFITKYLPVLDDRAVKVYIFALYMGGSGINYTAEDFAKRLNLSDGELLSCLEYLEEFELISILSRSPLEIRILDAENIYGTPKKLKPEKYAAFASAVQSVITGRMISTNEFMEYYYLLEEYSFEQNALIMIISYCVNLKGNDIKLAYIKKVAKNFAAEGCTTAKKVEEKLASYTSSTPSLFKIFSEAGIKGRPDMDDNALYEKWSGQMGFSDDAIICAAKHFKAKSAQRIDTALSELYKNKKFDPKEIEDYCRERNSLYACAGEIANALGVYMQNAAPYVDNYVSAWRDRGFEPSTLVLIAEYCFLQGKKSFEGMDGYINGLYDEGVITEDAVRAKIEKRAAEDKFIKGVLKRCGLERKIIENDRQSLKRWREWGFDDDMIFAAADSAQGKNNPIAYMNAVLSSWKNEGVRTTADIASPATSGGESSRAVIESHYYDLRAAAKARAEKQLARAMKDEEYARIRKRLNSLNISLAFAEVDDENKAAQISAEISELEKRSDQRLAAMGLTRADLEPKYKCSLCNDTGYDSHGRQCECLKKFIKSNKL